MDEEPFWDEETESEAWREDLQKLASNFRRERPAILSAYGMSRGFCARLLTAIIAEWQMGELASYKDNLLRTVGILRSLTPLRGGTLSLGFMQHILRATDYDLLDKTAWMTRGHFTTIAHFVFAYSLIDRVLGVALQSSCTDGHEYLMGIEAQFVRVLYGVDR